MKKLFTGMAIAACFLVACSANTGSTSTTDSAANRTERNRLTALKGDQDLSAHNVDAVLAACDTGVIDYGSGEDKPIKGIANIKKGLTEYLAAFPDLKGENFTAFAHGDSAIVIATWTGTFKNAMMGMQPTGKSFKYDDADIFTFNKAGKVTSHRSIQSSATFFKQLGINMPEPKK